MKQKCDIKNVSDVRSLNVLLSLDLLLPQNTGGIPGDITQPSNMLELNRDREIGGYLPRYGDKLGKNLNCKNIYSDNS